MTDPAAEAKQSFARQFGLRGDGHHPNDMEPDVPENASADEAAEILAGEGPDKPLSWNDANSTLGISSEGTLSPASPPVVGGGDAAPSEEMPEEGTEEWALKVLENASNPPDPGVEDAGEEEMVPRRVAQLESELASTNATIQEQRRQEELLLLEDDDDDLDDDPAPAINYNSPEVIATIAQSYGFDEETAAQVGKILEVTTQHFDEHVSQPRIAALERRMEGMQQGLEGDKNSDQTRRDIESNLSTAVEGFTQNGDELELKLIQQMAEHGADKSLLGQYFKQGNNQVLALSAEGISDATRTVAGRVRQQSTTVDETANGKAKRDPVGEQTYGSVGRAVRRDSATRKANAQDPVAELKNQIMSSGKSPFPFLG